MSIEKKVAVEQSVEETVHVLAALLKARPEFTELGRAAARVNADPQFQRLSREMRGTPGGLQHAWSPEQLEALPVVQAYRQAECSVRDLCHALDTVISEAAGVAFAANAKRSCCG